MRFLLTEIQFILFHSKVQARDHGKFLLLRHFDLHIKHLFPFRFLLLLEILLVFWIIFIVVVLLLAQSMWLIFVITILRIIVLIFVRFHHIILVVILPKRHKIIHKVVLLTALVLLQKHIIEMHRHFWQWITIIIVVLELWGEDEFKQVDGFPHGVELLVHLDVGVGLSHWGVQLDDCALLEFFISEDATREEDLEEGVWTFVYEFFKFEGLT